MKVIKFTSCYAHSSSISIYIPKIMLVSWEKSYDGTSLHLMTGKYITVKETPEEVERLYHG